MCLTLSSRWLSYAFMNIMECLQDADEKKVARSVRVSVHTVRKWRIGKRTPRPAHAVRLIRFFRGVLTMDGIYGKRARR